MSVKAETELAAVKPERETLLTIGVFDGVHLGHRRLIGTLIQKATQRGLESGVVTFYRHPKLVLSPHLKLAQLTSFEERVRTIKSLGVGLVVPLTFTPELAAVRAREFVLLLKKHLKMRGLIVGPNFALGRWREGNVDRLKELGHELGFTVEVVLPLMIEGSIVSSTSVREAIAAGEMARAGRLLGKHFNISGQVVGGDERGQTLGFRTANIKPASENALPPDGVYATLSRVGDRIHPSVTNIGTRPTFGGGERTIEVHIFDFDENLYGKTLDVEFVDYLRPEMRFENAGALVTQIKEDIERAREILRASATGDALTATATLKTEQRKAK